MEVGVSDITRCISDVPKYPFSNSLNDVSVGLFHASPQLCAVGPHRIQYCLYSISLLCIDRADLLSMSQYIFFYFSPSYSRFFLTCAFQRSLASNVMPRYFAALEWGMTLSFTIIGICWHLLLVKSSCTDWASFSLINHFLVQLFTLSTALCNFSVAASAPSPTAIWQCRQQKLPQLLLRVAAGQVAHVQQVQDRAHCTAQVHSSLNLFQLWVLVLLLDSEVSIRQLGF
jgi:hypothetical protein